MCQRLLPTATLLTLSFLHMGLNPGLCLVWSTSTASNELSLNPSVSLPIFMSWSSFQAYTIHTQTIMFPFHSCIFAGTCMFVSTPRIFVSFFIFLLWAIFCGITPWTHFSALPYVHSWDLSALWQQPFFPGFWHQNMLSSPYPGHCLNHRNTLWLCGSPQTVENS